MDTKCEAWDIYYHFFILSPPSRRRDIGGKQHKEWGRDWSVIVTAAGLWNISTDWQTVPGLTNVFVFVFQAASWQKDIGLHLLVIPAAYLLTNDIKPNTSCPASSNCHPDDIVEEMVLILFLWAKLAFSHFIGGPATYCIGRGPPSWAFYFGWRVARECNYWSSRKQTTRWCRSFIKIFRIIHKPVRSRWHSLSSYSPQS